MCLNRSSMYPDQNQNPNQPQYSIDYLNEIAPPSQKPGMSSKLFLFVVGGGLLLAVAVGLMLMTSGGGGPKEQMQTLAARMLTLQTIASESQKTIKSGELRSTNSNLSILLANANRDIAEPLLNNDVDVKKLDKEIVAQENGEELKKTLEDARLNAVFDRTYAREMAYQLDTIAALMGDIHASTKSKSLKEFLINADKNFQPINKQFTDFNAANG